MSILIQLNEAAAARRRVPFRLFTSDGTSPDTGASNDSVVLAVNSLGTIVPNVLVQAVEAAQGMYCVELTASDVSVLGTHGLYHEQGAFGQHVANVDVVAFDPYGSFTFASRGSLLQAGSTSAISFASHETSRDDWFNGAPVLIQYANGNVILNEVADYTGATFSAVLKNALPVAPTSSETYWVLPGTFNDLSNQTIGALDSSVTINNATYSAVTVQIQANTYSGVTVGVNNAAGDVSSRFTVSASSVGVNVASISGDATAADNLEAAFDGTGYVSKLTVNDVTNPTALKAGAYSTVTVDARPSSILSYDMGNSRLYQDMFHMVRNRKDVAADGSRVTFFKTDDSTALFGSSATSANAALGSMDP